MKIMLDKQDQYYDLFRILNEAGEQASMGKGLERHGCGQRFEDQQICQFGRWMGSIDFQIGQICKKALECGKLGPDAAVHELRGVINYAAAAIKLLEERFNTNTDVPEPVVVKKTTTDGVKKAGVIR